VLEIGDASVVLSAFKPSDDAARGGAVLRVWNQSGEAVEADLRLALPAASVQPLDLRERDAGEQIAHDRLRLAPHSIGTYRLGSQATRPEAA
jgi:alpha-mannosidase